ncbi:hypothetical protein ACHWQZ_G019324 [Mnemiopsis leidyi]
MTACGHAHQLKYYPSCDDVVYDVNAVVMAMFSDGGLSSPDIWIALGIILTSILSLLLNPLVFRHNYSKRKSIARDLYMALSFADFLSCIVLPVTFCIRTLAPKEDLCQQLYGSEFCQESYYNFTRPATIGKMKDFPNLSIDKIWASLLTAPATLASILAVYQVIGTKPVPGTPQASSNDKKIGPTNQKQDGEELQSQEDTSTASGNLEKEEVTIVEKEEEWSHMADNSQEVIGEPRENHREYKNITSNTGRLPLVPEADREEELEEDPEEQTEGDQQVEDQEETQQGRQEEDQEEDQGESQEEDLEEEEQSDSDSEQRDDDTGNTGIELRKSTRTGRRPERFVDEQYKYYGPK